MNLAVHYQFFLPFGARKGTSQLIPWSMCDRRHKRWGLVLTIHSNKPSLRWRWNGQEENAFLPEIQQLKPGSLPAPTRVSKDCSHVLRGNVFTAQNFAFLLRQEKIQATRESRLPREVTLNSRLLCLSGPSCWHGCKASQHPTRPHRMWICNS